MSDDRARGGIEKTDHATKGATGWLGSTLKSATDVASNAAKGALLTLCMDQVSRVTAPTSRAQA